MSESQPEASPAKYDPLAALRQPKFVLYISSRVFASTGQSLLQAVMLWQVYDISDSVLSLAILGLARFFPALGLSLVGGAAADRFNRRNIIMLAQIVPLVCGVILAVSTFGGWVRPELIYGLVLLLGLASSFESPARLALLPAIVRQETFANAVTVSSTLQTLGMLTGPVLAGAVIEFAGIGTAYAVNVGAVAAAIITMAFLRYQQADVLQRGVGLWTMIKEGVHFVRHRQVLLGAMSLDMFAVIFGGARGLLPVYARDILDAGPGGYGILLASFDAGAFLMAIVLIARPPILNSGRALIYSVAVFGILTMAFGLSRDFLLSIVLYAAIGAADEISVVMRNTIIQLATPDWLRGRVSSVSQVFIGASNQLGAVESGLVAAITSATFAVVSGGVGALVVAAAIGVGLPQLFRYQTPTGATHADLAGAPPDPQSEASQAAPPGG